MPQRKTNPIRWVARGREVVAAGESRVMGIVNVTPDSFSDGGRFATVAAAVDQAKRLEAEGAAIIDVGGESSRPGAEPVALEEELRRVLPAVEAMVGSISIPISIDTVKAEVARQALRAGAAIVNDITATTGDPDMPRVVAESDAGVVLMHMAGTPRTMQVEPRYDAVVNEVYDYLARRADSMEALGVTRERIALDPGIGFGKTTAHNVALLRHLDRFTSLGCAVLVGISRKGLLEKLTGRPLAERTTATVVASLAAIDDGASVVRVHDVGPMVDAIKVWKALRGRDGSP